MTNFFNKMPNFTESKILPYSAPDIFNLVMDIEKYPEFIPWCKSAKIVEKISENNLQADLLISFKGIMQKYRSDVTYFQDENGVFFVKAVAIEGPFKKLENMWKISENGENSCKIEFFIDFSFNSLFLQKMIGLIFEKATKKMVLSFENRAKELYK